MRASAKNERAVFRGSEAPAVVQCRVPSGWHDGDRSEPAQAHRYKARSGPP